MSQSHPIIVPQSDPRAGYMAHQSELDRLTKQKELC